MAQDFIASAIMPPAMSAKRIKPNVSAPIVAAGDRVLAHLRAMPERQLHTDVIWPLLRATGAEHLQYVHGAFERGKDFLFIRRDGYDDDQLEVCQVKNEAFSGNAASTSNTIAVLTQVLQCRSIEVFHPAQNRLETPTAVTLITTYDVPDKDVAGAQSLLSRLKEARCKIIGPTKLLRLIETHLPRYYAEVATPGEGVGRAILSHLMFHQEAGAFDLERKRLLIEFFVNLGLSASGSALNRLMRSTFALDFQTDSDALLRDVKNYKRLHDALPEVLRNCPIFRHEEPTSGSLGTQVRITKVELGTFLRTLSAQIVSVVEQDNTSTAHPNGRTLGDALRLLGVANEVLVAALRLMQRYVDTPHVTSPATIPSMDVPEVPPEALLQFRANLCFVGMGGSGKTTLARMIAQIALDQGTKCVYFPCTRIRHGESRLRPSMAEFIKGLDSDLTDSAISAYLRDATLFILDGADEATTYGHTLSEEIARLSFKGPVSVSCPNVGKEVLRVPQDLRNAVRHDTAEQKLILYRPMSALGFDRLRHANHGHFASTVDHLEAAYRNSGPRVIVTTREVGTLTLPADFHRIGLLPFNDEQIRKFYMKWFRDRPADAASVLDFLAKHADIQEICRTPMIATIVAAIHQNRARPPRTRTQVYQRRFELLLERWDQARGVESRNQIDMEDKLMLLSRLALTLHRQHRRTFTRSDLDYIWLDTLAQRYARVSIDDVIAELRFSNTVIYPSGNGEFSLGHLTYQEFLCARAVVFGQLQHELLSNFADPWWSQVVVFFAGLAGDIESFMKHVHMRVPLTAHRKDLLDQMTREASYTGGAARDAVADISDAEFGTLESEDDAIDEDYGEDDF